MVGYGKLLWQPDRMRQNKSALTNFASRVGLLPGADGCFDYRKVHSWSIEDPAVFWGHAADFLKISFQEKPSRIYQSPPSGKILGAKWFCGAKLNYAENLLKGLDQCQNPGQALISYAEGAARRVLSSLEIQNKTRFCQQALKKAGLRKGEPVGAVIANVPEALIAMLGVASLGGVWSSCSPDFGVDGIVDRLAQLKPRILFVTLSSVYGGKVFDNLETMRQVALRMPSVERIIWVDHLKHSEPTLSNICEDAGDAGYAGDGTPQPLAYKNHDWDQWLRWGAAGDPIQKIGAETIEFVACAPEDPLFVLFSSGTTGLPKCIIHSVLGTLLQHKKEHQLHCDMGNQDRLLYFTTCGWMMWNWMVSALGSGISLVLYEGAIQHRGFPTATEGGALENPDPAGPILPDLLWKVVGQEKVTVMGTSPKYLSYCMNQGLKPKEQMSPSSLDHLKTILSTGSPLLPEHCEWVYGNVSSNLHLASMSGGTDIISCFMLGNPWSPVYAGEIQGAGLGMALESWDDQGQALVGVKGELVCTKPFPAMPLGFWNDPDQTKFKQAYFEYFPNREVWRHGDFVEITPRETVVVYGRSDATLNPGGIRIGSAEIYRQVESMEGVEDSIVVGLREKDDTPMVLFVKLGPGYELSEDLIHRIKLRLRTSLTPRHVPKMVVSVPDIPYTRSGKKVEIAVNQAIHGEPIVNQSSISNPETLSFYRAWGQNRGGG